jgi:Uncharacterized protein conserved in bacteria
MRRLVFLLTLFALPLCAADQPAWIARSNANARLFLESLAEFTPELAGDLGLAGYDELTVDLGPDFQARTRAATIAVRDELSKRLAVETDPLVRQDLEILLKAAHDSIETSLLEERLVLPYIDIGELVFRGEFNLLQEQVDAARRPAAIARLRRYAGLIDGTTSIADLARARFTEALADASRLAPYRAEIEQHLANAPRYLAGLRQLFDHYELTPLDGASEALDTFEKQLTDYHDWIRAEVLPRARDDFRLPLELYTDKLKNVGIDIAPEALIQKAQIAYAEIRNEMQTIAGLVAKEKNLPDANYRAVLRELKKAQLTRDAVEPFYRDVITHIEDIIRREQIVALPSRPMIMRLASEAENAASPAPHMDPPPLIDNQGERGTFVLTTGNPPTDDTAAAETYDDFTFEAAAWTLTAHEGRPGHELQFTAMVERGVSQARSIFAFNSVNVEGWALYAEAELKPFEPLEGQLIALQFRLLRAARAFLDPMLHLGQITKERAFEILTEEVGLSRPMARQEVARYTFRAPGQATSYFYGYLRLMELRATTEIALGSHFDRQAFNDFILGQGLLPPDLLAKAVREEFIPAHTAKN